MENYTDVRKAAHQAIDILLGSPEFEGRATALELVTSIKEFRLNPVGARNARSLLISERRSAEWYILERIHATGLKRRCYFQGRDPLVKLVKVDPKYFRKQSLDMANGARIVVEGVQLLAFDRTTYNRVTKSDEVWTDYRRFDQVEMRRLMNENKQELPSFMEIEPMLDFMLAGPWIVD